MEMQFYLGTQGVNAYPLTRGEYCKFRGWDLPKYECGDDAGYLTESTDGTLPNTDEYAGYVSWLPKEQFEFTYCGNDFSFSHALIMMIEGRNMARRNWNGANMFVYHVSAHTPRWGGDVTHKEYLVIKDPEDNIVPWTATQTDILAHDWYEVI